MRSQTVHRDTNYKFYSLLEAFESLIGYPLLVNTLFNFGVSHRLFAQDIVVHAYRAAGTALSRRSAIGCDSTDFIICQHLRSSISA
jgi:hypothetical protein